MATLEIQYKNFLKDNPNSNISFKEWEKINARLIKQALVNMMKDDEELGLYEQIGQNNPVTKGSTALVKKETEELNPYIGPFLLKNGFMKQEDNVYTSPECTIVVFDSDYQIDFIDPQHGPVTMYTSWSIPHLVGTLTWHDLIDKNYIK